MYACPMSGQVSAGGGLGAAMEQFLFLWLFIMIAPISNKYFNWSRDRRQVAACLSVVRLTGVQTTILHNSMSDASGRDT
jgi:hypothetical protein